MQRAPSKADGEYSSQYDDDGDDDEDDAQALPANYTVDPEKELAYRILQKAKVTVSLSLVAKLPSTSDIVSQYGPAPRIHGLETCQAFRDAVPARDRYAAVAGLFNTGTNLLGELMARNCIIDGHAKGSGMRMQVPWGKHNPPATHRLRHVAKVGGTGVEQTHVFPLVLIKDFYHWTNSQCRHRYYSIWEHDADHCPNLISWRHGNATRVTVKYAKGKVRYASSFVGQWNEWYGEYEQQTSEFPLAILRFEDLLFYPEETCDALCTCVGGRRRRGNGGRFRYTEDSAKHGKQHEGANGLVSALVRYGDPNLRLEGWTKADWEFARDNLDGGLMERYGYNPPEWPE